MALWKEQTATMQRDTYDTTPRIEGTNGTSGTNGSVRHDEHAPVARPVARPHRADVKESVIAAELTIEGKIEGAGHVRIAGRFKGDIDVDGNVTVEDGAHLAGELRADTIVISGELQGNIHSASHVELMESGAITGDVKAGTLTVTKGSRMRGRVEFGWDTTSATSGETKKLEVATL
jgi:cytoskeletal protein CcmA (bactofilin family)